MKNKIKLRIGLLSRKHIIKIQSYLNNVLGVDPHKYLPIKLYYTCFNNICFVHEESGGIDKASLIYSGLWIGLIINDEPYLSPQLFEKIYSEIGYRASVIVNDKGVKNFLYGKDIFEESISEKYLPLNNPVSVIDYCDYRVIGVAKPLRKGIYKNIYDLGWFIRILG